MRTTFAAAPALLALAVTGDAVAQEVSSELAAYATLANGYWNRGLEQNGDLGAQLGIDYRHRAGWFVGGRLANVEYSVESTRPEPRELELDAYLGFQGRPGAWSWTVHASHYVYPGAADSYSYTELGTGFGYRDRFFYVATYADDLVPNDTTLNQELSISWPVAGDFEIGATVGRFAFERIPADYTHWNLGVSRIFKRFVFDVRYHDNDYELSTSLGDDTVDSVVLSITCALNRR